VLMTKRATKKIKHPLMILMNFLMRPLSYEEKRLQ
jgi:hypothetical protein